MSRAYRFSLLLLVALLGACASVSDRRPEVVRKSEYYLEHGVDAFSNSDYVTAADFFTKALAHYRSIDDTRGILLSLINLTETAMATGNTAAVIQRLDEAERVARNGNSQRYLPRLQLLRAQAYWREHSKVAVMPLLEPLLPAFGEDDAPLAPPSLLELTATTLRTDIAFSEIENHPDMATRWLRRLEAVLARNSDSTPLHDARLLRFQSQLKLRAGKIAAATELLEQALAAYRLAAHRPAIAATLTDIARLQMARDEWQAAEDTLQRALYIRLWTFDRIGSRETLLLLHAVYLKIGDNERAAEVLQQAEGIADSDTAVEALRREQLPK